MNLSSKDPILAQAPVCVSKEYREILVDAIAGELVGREEYIDNFDRDDNPVMYEEAVENYEKAKKLLAFVKQLPECE